MGYAPKYIEGLEFASYSSYDDTKTQSEVVDLGDLPEGIVPLGSFIAALSALYDEAGEDKPFLFILSQEAGDAWFKRLSVIVQKEKSPEELEKIMLDRLRAKQLAEENDWKLYILLKAKYES